MRALLKLVPVGLMVFGSVAGWAQSGPVVSKADVAEASFEESIRDFGYVSGAAYQCLPENQRLAHERGVIGAFDGLVRLFGSDRAFYYAAAFGAGSIDKIDKARCAEFIERYNSAIKSAKQD